MSSKWVTTVEQFTLSKGVATAPGQLWCEGIWPSMARCMFKEKPEIWTASVVAGVELGAPVLTEEGGTLQ